MDEILQVVTTVDSREAADTLARQLIEQRLAACVQIDGPIVSVYRWRGTVEQAEEWRLTIKSLASLYARLETTLRKLHSYETPEIVATQVTHASDSYRTWLIGEVSP